MTEIYQLIRDILALHVPIILTIILTFIYYCFSRFLAFWSIKTHGYPTIENSCDAYGKEIDLSHLDDM